MGEELIFQGKRYVTAAAAASSAGYTNDYVARLCREGKVEGRMVGKTWHVEEDSFFHFVLEANQQKEKRKKELSRTRKKEYGFSEPSRPFLEKEVVRASVVAPHAPPGISSRIKKNLVFREGKGLTFALSLLLVLGIPTLGFSLKEATSPTVIHNVLGSAAFLIHDNPRLAPLAAVARTEARILENTFFFLGTAGEVVESVVEEAGEGVAFAALGIHRGARASASSLQGSFAAALKALASRQRSSLDTP